MARNCSWLVVEHMRTSKKGESRVGETLGVLPRTVAPRGCSLPKFPREVELRSTSLNLSTVTLV